MDDKQKILYDAVSKDYNLGTFDEFKSKLAVPEKRKAFYDGVGHQYNLGTFDEFSAKVISPPDSQSPQSFDVHNEQGITHANDGSLLQARLQDSPERQSHLNKAVHDAIASNYDTFARTNDDQKNNLDTFFDTLKNKHGYSDQELDQAKQANKSEFDTFHIPLETQEDRRKADYNKLVEPKSNIINAFTGTFGKLIGQSIEAVSVLNNSAGKLIGVAPDKPTDDLIYKTGKWLKDQSESLLPETKGTQIQFLPKKLAESFGINPDVDLNDVAESAATMIYYSTGQALGGPVAAQQLGQSFVNYALKSGAKLAVEQIPAATSAFTQGFDAANEKINDAKKLSNQQYIDKYGKNHQVPEGQPQYVNTDLLLQEKQKLATDDGSMVFKAGLGDAISTGIAFGMPIAGALEKVNMATDGALSKVLSKGFKGSVTGMTQMATMQYLENASAKQTYDTTRNIWDNVAQAGTSGAIANGLLEGLGATLHSLSDKYTATPDKSYIKAAQDYVEQKKQDVSGANPIDPIKEQHPLPEVEQLKNTKENLEKQVNDGILDGPALDIANKRIDDLGAEIETKSKAGNQIVGDNHASERILSDLSEKENALTEASKSIATPEESDIINNQLEEVKAQKVEAASRIIPIDQNPSQENIAPEVQHFDIERQDIEAEMQQAHVVHGTEEHQDVKIPVKSKLAASQNELQPRELVAENQLNNNNERRIINDSSHRDAILSRKNPDINDLAKRKEYGEAIKKIFENELKGVLPIKVAGKFIERAAKVRTEASFDSLLKRISRTVENANYEFELSDAEKAKVDAGKLSGKNYIPYSNRQILSELSKVNPSILSEPTDYTNFVKELKNAYEGRQGSSFTLSEQQEKLQGFIDEQKQALKEKALQSNEELLSGIDTSGMSATEITELVDAINGSGEEEGLNAKQKSVAEKYLDTAIPFLKDDIKNIDKTNLSTFDKIVVDGIENINDTDYSLKEKKDLKNALEAAIQNNDFSELASHLDADRSLPVFQSEMNEFDTDSFIALKRDAFNVLKDVDSKLLPVKAKQFFLSKMQDILNGNIDGTGELVSNAISVKNINQGFIPDLIKSGVAEVRDGKVVSDKIRDVRKKDNENAEDLVKDWTLSNFTSKLSFDKTVGDKLRQYVYNTFSGPATVSDTYLNEKNNDYNRDFYTDKGRYGIGTRLDAFKSSLAGMTKRFDSQIYETHQEQFDNFKKRIFRDLDELQKAEAENTLVDRYKGRFDKNYIRTAEAALNFLKDKNTPQEFLNALDERHLAQADHVVKSFKDNEEETIFTEALHGKSIKIANDYFPTLVVRENEVGKKSIDTQVDRAIKENIFVRTNEGHTKDIRKGFFNDKGILDLDIDRIYRSKLSDVVYRNKTLVAQNAVYDIIGNKDLKDLMGGANSHLIGQFAHNMIDAQLDRGGEKMSDAIKYTHSLMRTVLSGGTQYFKQLTTYASAIGLIKSDGAKNKGMSIIYSFDGNDKAAMRDFIDSVSPTTAKRTALGETEGFRESSKNPFGKYDMNVPVDKSENIFNTLKRYSTKPIENGDKRVSRATFMAAYIDHLLSDGKLSNIDDFDYIDKYKDAGAAAHAEGVLAFSNNESTKMFQAAKFKENRNNIFVTAMYTFRQFSSNNSKNFFQEVKNSVSKDASHEEKIQSLKQIGLMALAGAMEAGIGIAYIQSKNAVVNKISPVQYGNERQKQRAEKRNEDKNSLGAIATNIGYQVASKLAFGDKPSIVEDMAHWGANVAYQYVINKPQINNKNEVIVDYNTPFYAKQQGGLPTANIGLLGSMIDGLSQYGPELYWEAASNTWDKGKVAHMMIGTLANTIPFPLASDVRTINAKFDYNANNYKRIKTYTKTQLPFDKAKIMRQKQSGRK